MNYYFRNPSLKERNSAVEVAEAFDLEYSNLTNLQLKTIYCMIKQVNYDHKIMLETVKKYKDFKSMFWVMTEYVKCYEKFHFEKVTGEKIIDKRREHNE